MELIRGMEHLFFLEERLRQLKLFSLEKIWLQGDIVAFQYLKEACKKDGEKHFNWSCYNRTRGKDYQLKEGRFRVAIREFLPMRMVKHWYRLPRGVVNASSLEILMVRLDRALSNLI